jgi:hypothetical protein
MPFQPPWAIPAIDFHFHIVSTPSGSVLELGKMVLPRTFGTLLLVVGARSPTGR